MNKRSPSKIRGPALRLVASLTLPTLKRYHGLLSTAEHADMIYSRMRGLRDRLQAGLASGSECRAYTCAFRFDLYETEGVKMNRDAFKLGCRLRKAIEDDGRIQEAINTLTWLLNQYDPPAEPLTEHEMVCTPYTLDGYCLNFSHYDHAATIFSEISMLREGFRKHKDDADQCRALLDSIKPQYDPNRYRWLLTKLRKAIDGGRIEQAINTLDYLVERGQQDIGEATDLLEAAQRTEAPQPQPTPEQQRRDELLARFPRQETGCKGIDYFTVKDTSLIAFGIFAGDILCGEDSQPADGDMVLMSLDDELVIAHISISYATPERFTIKPLMSEEKILLPAKNLSDILLVVLSIGVGTMECASSKKDHVRLMGAKFTSSMPPVTAAGRREA